MPEANAKRKGAGPRRSAPRADSPLARAWAERLAERSPAKGPGWLEAVRARAVETFLEHGLPGNKDEPWKYTPLRRLETLAPSLREEAGETLPLSYEAPLPDLSGFGFRWLDGRIDFLDTAPPDGVTLLRLENALEDENLGPRLRNLFESVDLNGRSRAFEALNTAVLASGVVVHVAEGVDAGRCLAHWALPARAGSGLHNVRFCVLLDRDARIDLVEQFRPPESAGSSAGEGVAQALNLVFQADLAEGATLSQVRVQDDARDGVLLTFADLRQAASSRYRYAGFELGGGLVRHAIESRLEGEGAEAEINGAFVVDGERHVDYHIRVDHRAPMCVSEQLFRGVLGGRSRGVWNGKAVIRPGADGSRVRQSNANLLLSRDAEIDTKPELEIYADEVEASHGATVGQLDEAAVFYLRTRGLDESSARRMLTTAFCREVAERLGDGALSEPIARLLEAAMPAQGSE